MGDGSDHLAYGVTAEEFYRDFRDVANLVGTRPIVTVVHELEHQQETDRANNDKEHKTIRLQVYLYMAAVAGALGTLIALRLGVA